MVEFTPPVKEVDILEVSQYQDQRVNSLTALIIDSLNNKFTIVVATAAKIAMDAIESPDDTLSYLEVDREPVFVVAGNEINPTQIDEILTSLEPELLRTYLTLQE